MLGRDRGSRWAGAWTRSAGQEVPSRGGISAVARTGCAPRCSAPTTASCRPRASCSAWPPRARRRARSSPPASPGLVAGALSMAAGEYVSVSSQRDAEQADLRLEERELAATRPASCASWPAIYEHRGLPPALACEVADALSRRGALAAHARDELGLDEQRLARPLQAAGRRRCRSRRARRCRCSPSRSRRPARGAVAVVVTLSRSRLLGDLGARLGGAPPRRAASASSPGARSRWRHRGHRRARRRHRLPGRLTSSSAGSASPPPSIGCAQAASGSAIIRAKSNAWYLSPLTHHDGNGRRSRPSEGSRWPSEAGV